MNKYEEALEHIEVNIDDFAVHFDIERSLNTIKELVKRATPTQCNDTIKGVRLKEGFCPHCDGFVIQSYICCPWCGQALDWSDVK